MSWMFSPGTGCTNCGCDQGIAACCAVEDLPETALLTFTLNGTTTSTMELTKLGNGYTGEYQCDVDANTYVVVQLLIACFESYWALSFFVGTYIIIGTPVLHNFVTWDYSLNIGTNTSDPSSTNPNVSCEPCFSLHFEGVNTGGVAEFSDNPQACDGVNYPFSLPGLTTAVLDIVGLCEIECISNPDELMPATLKVVATVCDIDTILPDIIYEESDVPGVYHWHWEATQVEPAVPLVAITGCAGSDASWEGHTLCFQAVQFSCGASPGSWPVLSLGMYNVLGLFSPKGSSGFALTSTSPFDITYEFSEADSSDISGIGCCVDPSKKIFIRIYQEV